MKTTKVKVLDKVITIQTDEDEDYLKKLVNIIEEEVWSVRKNCKAVPADHLLLVAMLNIVDRFIKDRKALENKLRLKIENIIGEIDKVI